MQWNLFLSNFLSQVNEYAVAIIPFLRSTMVREVKRVRSVQNHFHVRDEAKLFRFPELYLVEKYLSSYPPSILFISAPNFFNRSSMY